MGDLKLNLSNKKTTNFLLIGTALYLGSSYINTLKEHSADYGVYLSIVIIVISLFVQSINWIIYFAKDEEEYNVSKRN